MGQTPDELRAEIAGTRDEMSEVVNAISQKVSPKQATRRQVGRARYRLSGIRTALMGKVEDVSDSIQGAAGAATAPAQGLAQTAQRAPDRALAGAQGNPLAAGLMAFGLGLLLASTVPASERERQMAVRVGESARPAVEHAQGMATDLKDGLQTSAQAAVGHVKEAATTAAQEVKEHATSSAQDVGQTARQAANDLGSQVQQSAPTARSGS